MPTTTYDAERPPVGGTWATWKPPLLPVLPTGLLWQDQPWHEDISGWPVDDDRTARLRGLPNAGATIRCKQGGPVVDGVWWGSPYQQTDGMPLTKCTDNRNLWSYPKRLPLPPIVRRYGDPSSDTKNDGQWCGVDVAARRIIEVSSLGNKAWWLAAMGRTTWHYGNRVDWDLTKPWQDQPGGILAGRVPLLPMLPRPEELATGHVNHALHFVSPDYAKGEVTGMCRGTDGSIPGHPIRAGERMRLRLDRVPLVSNPYEGAIVGALLKHGGVNDDRSQTTHGNIRTAVDPRYKINLSFRWDDFEVVRPPTGYSDAYSNAYG